MNNSIKIVGLAIVAIIIIVIVAFAVTKSPATQNTSTAILTSNSSNPNSKLLSNLTSQSWLIPPASLRYIPINFVNSGQITIQLNFTAVDTVTNYRIDLYITKHGLSNMTTNPLNINKRDFIIGESYMINGTSYAPFSTNFYFKVIPKNETQYLVIVNNNTVGYLNLTWTKVTVTPS
jgi:hypothetical protein